MPAPRAMLRSVYTEGCRNVPFGRGGGYASWRLPDDYVVQGITGDWCDDCGCLVVLKSRCAAADWVCVPPGNRVQQHASEVDYIAGGPLELGGHAVACGAGLGWTGRRMERWAGLRCANWSFTPSRLSVLPILQCCFRLSVAASV